MKQQQEDENDDEVEEVNHFGKNRLNHLKRNLRMLVAKRDKLAAKQLENVTHHRELRLGRLENSIQEAEASLEKTRELRNQHFSK